MKALVYVGEEKLDFREVADPVVNSGEQLIKVDSAGICGYQLFRLQVVLWVIFLEQNTYHYYMVLFF